MYCNMEMCMLYNDDDNNFPFEAIITFAVAP